MKTKKHIWLLMLGIFFISTGVIFANQGQRKLGSSDENLRKIFAQGKIINEGQSYLRSLQFEKALAKYEDALNPELLTSNDGLYYPIGLKVRCFQYQGKYDEALAANQWYFKQKIFQNVRIDYQEKPRPVKQTTVKDTVIDDEIKLKALAEWKQTKSAKSLYDYIDYIRSKYLFWLPPKRADVLIFSDIAELYDLIGDHDAGIAWAKSFKKTTKDKRDKQEYENVVKAFEESRQGLPKICGDEGKTCVGRATAYIIQSDQI